MDNCVVQAGEATRGPLVFDICVLSPKSKHLFKLKSPGLPGVRPGYLPS